MDGRQRSLIENALYYANPPKTPQAVAPQEPPLRRYVKKLLYKDLNKLNTEKVWGWLRQGRWACWGCFRLYIWVRLDA